MSQHDYTVADGNGTTVLDDINLALKALASNNSGATEPSTPYAFMWWADTANDMLKQRNAANTAWVNKLTLSGGVLATQTEATALAQQEISTTSRSDNPVTNGEMLVDQVNAGAAVTVAVGSTTATTYTVDGHYAWAVGATVQAQQIALGQLGFRNGLQFTGAASVSAVGHGFRIEARDSARFKNKTVTVPVRMYNSLLTSVTWVAYYVNAADTFGTNGSGAKTQIATGTITLTAADTTLRDYSFSFAAGASADNGIVVEFTVGAQTSGTWVITGEDIVEGSQSRPYPHLKYGEVLNQCLRYYYRKGFVGVGVGPYIDTYQAAGNVISLFVSHPVRMFTSPTITKVGTWTVANCAQPSVTAADADGVVLYSTVTVLGRAAFYPSANTDGITASARL